MNYYNDIDPKVCRKLEQLVSRGLIPDGHVDCRSIEDVIPSELAPYDQCHFFAGVAGWPRALQLANISPTERLWTGSPPCQPFSASGLGKGFDDKRHLWPAFRWLIQQCRPAKIFGEQVVPAIGKRWLDGVFNDLEALHYACGSAVLPACSVNAPHRRERIFIVAHRDGIGTQVPLARRLATEQELCRHFAENRPWDRFDAVLCEDGKTRRCKPGTPLLGDGIPGAMAMINQFGNAIVPQVGAVFITATHGGVQ